MGTLTKTTSPSTVEVQSVIAALEELHTKMTILTPLSEEQRGELRGSRLGPRNWRVLQGRVEAARKHRDLLPPAFDLRKFERDVELTDGLLGCLAKLDQLRAEVNDTVLSVGSRALQAGAVAYGHIKVAVSAKDQLHRKVDTLAARSGRSRNAKPAPAPSASDVAPAEGPESPPKNKTPQVTSGPAPAQPTVAPKQDAA